MTWLLVQPLWAYGAEASGVVGLFYLALRLAGPGRHGAHEAPHGELRHVSPPPETAATLGPGSEPSGVTVPAPDTDETEWDAWLAELAAPEEDERLVHTGDWAAVLEPGEVWLARHTEALADWKTEVLSR